ncbi:type II secretion system protein N [Sandarakinorhabdus sp. DWP1-3-1]|uniref:type II secretion system protein N n=1 Tax=Sandarakinorhabdus sp. DWP1-3-1 TaxID=2804627 RepID=UPI003CF3407E
MHAAELAALAVLALAAARLFWAVVTPVTPLGDWQPPATTTATVDRSILGSFDPFFRQPVDDGRAQVSGLALTLVGTRVDTVSGRGSAIIAAGDGVQSSYLVGETVQPGVTLQAVGFDSVTLLRGGTPEKLFLDQSAGGIPVTPAAIGAAPNAGPAPRLAADVQVTPRLNGSAITGYVLAPKGSGAAFATAGLQPGDVLVSVDGAPVAALGDPAALARQLDSGGIEIGVERGGRIVKLRIAGSR